MGNAAAASLAMAEAECKLWREERDLRDSLARDAMLAVLKENPGFLSSSANIDGAGRRFYELADAMIKARRRGPKEAS
jgi:hypothetical protein